MEFKNLLLILSISSSLLISSNAVPSYQIFKLHDFLPASTPVKTPANAPVQAPEPTLDEILNSIVSGTTKVGDKTTTPEIEKFCTDTTNPTLCVESFSKVLSAPVQAPEPTLDEILNSIVSGTTKVGDKITTPEIEKFCAGTTNPTLCVESFSKVLSAPVQAPEPTLDEIVNSVTSGTTKVGDKITTPEIEKFCADTTNPTLCVESFSKVLSTNSFDPIKAVEIEVDETLKQAVSVVETITKLQKDPSTDKKLMDALDICSSQYGDMLDAIKEATELMQQQNIVDAYYKFNAVITYKAACDDAFLETPGVNHVPFEADEIPLYDLSGNVLAMMNGIVNGFRM